jgi:hypothetical protein
MNRILPLLALFPILASASKSIDDSAYRPQILRVSESHEFEAGLGDRLSAIYAGLKGPALPSGKVVPDRPTIHLQLIGYLAATVVVEKIQIETAAKDVKGAKPAITVIGTVLGESDSRVQLVLLGDALVGSVRLEGGETYLLDPQAPGRYVVEELKASWQVSAQSEQD